MSVAAPGKGRCPPPPPPQIHVYFQVSKYLLHLHTLYYTINAVPFYYNNFAPHPMVLISVTVLDHGAMVRPIPYTITKHDFPYFTGRHCQGQRRSFTLWKSLGKHCELAGAYYTSCTIIQSWYLRRQMLLYLHTSLYDRKVAHVSLN